jgi:hypothetical protein
MNCIWEVCVRDYAQYRTLNLHDFANRPYTESSQRIIFLINSLLSKQYPVVSLWTIFNLDRTIPVSANFPYFCVMIPKFCMISISVVYMETVQITSPADHIHLGPNFDSIAYLDVKIFYFFLSCENYSQKQSHICYTVTHCLRSWRSALQRNRELHASAEVPDRVKYTIGGG